MAFHPTHKLKHGTRRIYQEGRDAFRNSVGSLYMRTDSVDAPSLWEQDEDINLDTVGPRGELLHPAVHSRGRSTSVREQGSGGMLQ